MLFFPKPLLSSKQKLFLYFIIASILLLRFFSLGVYDLADTTESRYASIAMRMVLNHDWITPRYFFEPFLAKPPLSFWATALSFKLFGFSEFTARLPHFLIMVIMSGYSYLVLRKTSKDLALFSCAIFISTIMWSVLAGGVMTDAYLSFGLGIVMLSFYQIMIMGTKSNAIGYLFFIGIAICMLGKGPLGIVISGLSIGVYLLITKNFKQGIKDFWKKFPVITGSLLSMVIFLPWYVMAEIKTPGFLHYFIIGEHFDRFLISNWKGDLYGHAHKEPIGMIWLFFLLAVFPWSLYMIFNFVPTFVRNRDKFLSFFKSDSNLYFAVWTIIPLLFFTLAKNIIIPYATLSLLAFSICLASYFLKNNFNHKIINGLFLVPTVILIILIIRPDYIGKDSDKAIIATFLESKKPILAVYKYKPRHSTYFYSRDKIITLHNKKELSECYNCFIIIDDIGTQERNKIEALVAKNNSIVVVASEKR